MKIALAPDGAELAWAEEGQGGPLLLIAGQATAMDGWGPTAEALAEHFRVIRFDHRGIGGSSNGHAGRYTTRPLAADAAAVLEAANVESAHVYGHSMGGRVAQWLAIDHPQRVRALILAATSGGKLAGAEPTRHIRCSTLVKVPGAGHGLHLDRPETIQWIRQFIAAKAAL
ncbi:alpha/beta fold hydrolase [Arthrobacter sp. MDT3-24]